MKITYKQRKRLPKPQDIGLVWRALSTTFPMEPPLHGWRQSLKGVVNYRIQSTTNDRDWSVDIYAGGFFVATINHRTEPCKSIPSLVVFLCRMLRIKPRRPSTD